MHFFAHCVSAGESPNVETGPELPDPLRAGHRWGSCRRTLIDKGLPHASRNYRKGFIDVYASRKCSALLASPVGSI